MKDSQSSSQHHYPNFVPQNVRHDVYPSKIISSHEITQSQFSQPTTSTQISQQSSTLSRGAELSHTHAPPSLLASNQTQKNYDGYFDKSHLTQQIQILPHKSSDYSLNEGFYEGYSQDGKESKGPVDKIHTHPHGLEGVKVLDPSLLDQPSDLSSQLLSPETKVPEKGVVASHHQHQQSNPTHHSSVNVPVSLGFPNLGNTCYMNSVLQCLINNERLYEYFIEGKHLIVNPDSLLTECFVEVLSTAFARKVSTEDMFKPLSKLKNTLERVAPIFEGYAQNDAHEFFRLLIEKIHDELNNAPKKNVPYTEFKPSKRAKSLQQIAEEWWGYSRERDNSIITSTFGGVLVNEVICTKCKEVSHSFEDALDLSLDIINSSSQSSSHFHHVKSLDTCLKEFITNEFIEDYTCSKCKKRNTSLKKTTIWKQPETLVVQFKRFVYDHYGERRAVKEKVSFPLQTLSLNSYMHERANDMGHKYRLCGIINHFGNLDSGHYIAVLYNDQTKTWLQYNDDKVTRIHEKEIAHFAKGSQEPYILFYKKY